MNGIATMERTIKSDTRTLTQIEEKINQETTRLIGNKVMERTEKDNGALGVITCFLTEVSNSNQESFTLKEVLDLAIYSRDKYLNRK